MPEKPEPLIFIQHLERVLSPGFIQQSLKEISSVFIVRPGVDPVSDLEGLLEVFRTPFMRAVTAKADEDNRKLN